MKRKVYGGVLLSLLIGGFPTAAIDIGMTTALGIPLTYTLSDDLDGGLPGSPSFSLSLYTDIPLGDSSLSLVPEIGLFIFEANYIDKSYANRQNETFFDLGNIDVSCSQTFLMGALLLRYNTSTLTGKIDGGISEYALLDEVGLSFEVDYGVMFLYALWGRVKEEVSLDGVAVEGENLRAGVSLERDIEYGRDKDKLSPFVLGAVFGSGVKIVMAPNLGMKFGSRLYVEILDQRLHDGGDNLLNLGIYLNYGIFFRF